MTVFGLRILFLLLACAVLPAARRFDVVVYGGTAGGVVTAVSAAREGLKVALIEPGSHLGGMVSGGLSYTDIGRREVIGGYALEFYWRAGRHYETRRQGHDVSWYHEPHVAEEIFRQMLNETGVVVLTGRRLREKDGVRKSGARLLGISMESGETYLADVFVDSSYEGDLMAQAGVAYTWGRESMAQYGESLAGVRAETPYHQFTVNVSPYDENGRLLPEVQSGPVGEVGAADKKVQAYNFRFCFSEDPANQVPFAKPAGYDPKRYALLARLLKARTEKEGHAPALRSVIKIDPIPNRKADVNNQGAFSTDFIGGSWEYPNAGYKKRAEIWRAHKDYIAGFFYFLASDPQTPEPLRKEMNQWGLCKDEFADTDHWPRQLYIREARRMVGDFVVTQKDLQTELTKPDAIGMGSYNSDSHNIQRIVTPEGYARNEGDMQVAVTPYQIPYRVMLPKRSDVQNLLVPVAFSASHVAYSSLRMEPQYMIIGQAAGVAAAMAIRARKPAQEIDTKALTEKLKERGAILEYVPSTQAPVIRQFQQRPAR